MECKVNEQNGTVFLLFNRESWNVSWLELRAEIHSLKLVDLVVSIVMHFSVNRLVV